MRTDPFHPWRGLDVQLSQDEQAVFAVSTKMVVGDRASALFSDDHWLDDRAISEVEPQLLLRVSLRTRKRRTIREALTDRSWITDIRGALSPLALWQ